MKFSKADDWTLLAEATNSKNAFTILFDRHCSYAYRVAVKLTGNEHVSDDIVQEVFLRIYQQKNRFRKKANFRTFLYSITLNVVREHWRTERRNANLMKQYEPDVPDTVNRDQSIQKLGMALQQLPEKQREVIVLRFYEKLNVKETAEIMGCREGTVKSNLHWALKSLKERFKNE